MKAHAQCLKKKMDHGFVACAPYWPNKTYHRQDARYSFYGRRGDYATKAAREFLERCMRRRRHARVYQGQYSSSITFSLTPNGVFKNPKFIGYRTINKSGFPLLPTASKSPPRTPQVKGALKRESREITADGDGDDISRVQAKKKRVQLRFADE